MSFESLGLIDPLLKAVQEAGYSTPTPIQAQAIPAVLNGGDLLAGAQTGTGKTAGFTLPLLHKLALQLKDAPREGKRPVRALILTPTRELAAQVEECVRTYGKYLPLKSLVIFGGVGMNPQIDALRRGVDILVATPGRLLDLHQQGAVDLAKVEYFVLDEADRMLDMGFIHDIRRVLGILPPKKQSLLFSATFSDEIKALAERLLDRPQVIEVARRNATADTIGQRVFPVSRDRKKDLLAHLIKSNDWNQVLVFTRMKHGANRLVEFLNKQEISAMAIHGNKSQSARTRALSDFKSGELQVLVATDIAARGIDIDQLPHVVNYELPNVSEDYVHRIGRTGRAGAEGEAVSLVCVDEEGFLADIEKLIKRAIPREVIAGYEPHPEEKPEPIQLGRRVLHGALGSRGGSRPNGAGASGAGQHNGPRGNGGGNHRKPNPGAKAAASHSGQASANQGANAHANRRPTGAPGHGGPKPSRPASTSGRASGPARDRSR